MDKFDWLKELQEGEEIRGYNRPQGGMTGQGTLVRMSTGQSCPMTSPSVNGVDNVDDALDDTIIGINFGLAAAGSRLFIDEARDDNETFRYYNEDDSSTVYDGTGQNDEARDAFNRHKEPLYIRYIVKTRKEG